MLEELDKKAEEIRRYDREVIPADVLNRLQDAERADIFDKIEAIRSSWTMSRSAVEARLQLAAMYYEFHKSAAELEAEMDRIEAELKSNADHMTDDKMNDLERRWATMQPCYSMLTSNGKKFLDESTKVTFFLFFSSFKEVYFGSRTLSFFFTILLQIVDSYLDVPRACLCIGSIMDRFSNRQCSVNQNYESMVTTVTTKKELRIEQEKRLEESEKVCYIKL